ncbi:hypothetical protein E3N88_43686 [Mikania micrantha]|uniref:pyruvate dehydrogenase (acetyl-transferring) n=1 Tax=Mikania micrantha TaxID=192012 RepID=A0A5N6LED0_9ASTR|nr:hypothetical protein E3N88_43686 [Mikania micrantha]
MISGRYLSEVKSTCNVAEISDEEGDQAAQTLVNKGYDPEVIDIRSLKPFDLYTIGNSIKKTHRVLIVELGHVYPLISLRMVDDISDWTLEIN